MRVNIYSSGAMIISADVEHCRPKSMRNRRSLQSDQHFLGFYAQRWVWLVLQVARVCAFILVTFER
jgi:hypothetical protein